MSTIRTQYIEPVMFICEVSGNPVPTGHRMRATDFELIKGPRSFRCADCGRIHTWTVDTAWLGLKIRDAAA
jgi:hypothetical protein